MNQNSFCLGEYFAYIATKTQEEFFMKNLYCCFIVSSLVISSPCFAQDKDFPIYKSPEDRCNIIISQLCTIGADCATPDKVAQCADQEKVFVKDAMNKWKKAPQDKRHACVEEVNKCVEEMQRNYYNLGLCLSGKTVQCSHTL